MQTYVYTELVIQALETTSRRPSLWETPGIWRVTQSEAVVEGRAKRPGQGHVSEFSTTVPRRVAIMP